MCRHWIERHPHIFAAAEQLGLVEKSGAARDAVLAAEQDQMIAVGIGQVEQVAGIVGTGRALRRAGGRVAGRVPAGPDARLPRPVTALACYPITARIAAVRARDGAAVANAPIARISRSCLRRTSALIENTWRPLTLADPVSI